MTTAIDQLKTITNGMNLYFTQLAAFFTTPSNPVPSFEDFVDLLVYDVVLTEALNSQDRSPSYIEGALTDLAQQAMAIHREFNIRSKTKGDYYGDAIHETTISAEYYTAMYGLYYNYFRRTTPEQSRP